MSEILWAADEAIEQFLQSRYFLTIMKKQYIDHMLNDLNYTSCRCFDTLLSSTKD